MSRSRKGAVIALAALAMLQLVWHGLWFPPTRLPITLALGLSLAPLLLVAVLIWRRRPSGVFWGAVFSLFYFCHGISEAWTTRPTLWAGLLESGLAIAVIVLFGWDGLIARRRKSVAQTPHV